MKFITVRVPPVEYTVYDIVGCIVHRDARTLYIIETRMRKAGLYKTHSIRSQSERFCALYESTMVCVRGNGLPKSRQFFLEVFANKYTFYE